MRLQTVGRPDPLHGAMADPGGFGHRSPGPVRQLGAMRRRHRAFQIEQHVHRNAPRSNRRRRLRPALTGVAVPPASPAVVVLSASSSATISAPRSAVDPVIPARTAGSAVLLDVSSNLSPKAESLARRYSAKGIRVRTDPR